ncbi:heme ABC exporter ATP-binding protein CcmA [Paralimibaculum aggregatum]|uniref:Heme ABC exporter ATP-binding protein CcmA n=1 Tax=Paralimibaculum aggregatum TaxID=3036245 RepID=A0ABQ6LET2_9RHOB|nr:heme ABC exporter ATP-binding protein CcmA [Limibaculum sp. NKW23]GMG80906.1 heme ABC exporter ATP-binding protein CcmA [Limibaculum sp. NKW23]
MSAPRGEGGGEGRNAGGGRGEGWGDALAVEGLGCDRAGRRVLSGLSFRLAPGEALALKGPNGVGKSTLLRLLAGFLPMAEGTAMHGPVSLAADRAAFQERIAFAGHLDAVKPALTVADNLGLWAGLHGTGAARAAAALARFGLERIAGRPAAECSAGQRRRLGLARLLVIDRPLWLLDEPTVSLDTASARLVAELIGAHIARGGAALVATHIELGLPGLGTLTLAPPAEAAPARSADPFLEGRW